MTAVPMLPTGATPAHPQFFGVVRGEVFKITRMRATWIMAILLTGILCLPWLAFLLIPTAKDALVRNPENWLVNATQANLAVLRVFLGFMITILAVLVVGTDYQQGTIRVILARGVERLQLIAAKGLAVLTAAAIALVAALVLQLTFWFFVHAYMAGGFSIFQHLGTNFWAETGQYELTVIISTVASAALGIAATVLGRSLAFGMAVALSFFPADNFGTLIMFIVSQVTNNDFWLKITMYFLGPNLNVMPQVFLPHTTTIVQTESGSFERVRQALTLGNGPLQPVDFTHSLVVTLVWFAAFLAISGFITWRRDVLE